MKKRSQYIAVSNYQQANRRDRRLAYFLMSQLHSILITGASSGIGEALAFHYANDGVSLFLSGRDTERLADVADGCRSMGARVYASAVDVTDRKAMLDWITASDSRAALDLIVANAGISGGTSGSVEKASQSRRIFAVNLDGVLNTVLPGLEVMGIRGTGQIVIISSLAGFLPMPGAPAYSASKAAVRYFGEALRPSAGRLGVGISVVCPGFVHSRMTAANPFFMPFIMKTERAAEIIARGIKRDRARIAFPLPMYAAVYALGQLMPQSVLRFLLTRLPQKPAADMVVKG